MKWVLDIDSHQLLLSHHAIIIIILCSRANDVYEEISLVGNDNEREVYKCAFFISVVTMNLEIWY